MATKYRYERIYETLKKRIEDSTYPRDAKLPGARTLANEFDTTAVTVDKALALLESEGYLVRKAKKGSFVRQSFGNGGDNTRTKTGLVGAIVFDSSVSVYWSQVLSGMEDAVSEQNRHLVVGHSDHSVDKAIKYIDELTKKGIDGFIYVPIDMPDRETYERENGKVIRVLDKTERPYVLFDRHVLPVKRNFVGPDSYEPTLSLVNFLMNQDVQSPLCVSLYYGTVIGEREEAFVETLRAHGVTDPDSRILRLETYRLTNTSIDAVQDALRAQGEIDGIFCINSNTMSIVTEIVSQMPAENRPIIVGFRELEVLKSDLVAAQAIQPIHLLGRKAGELILHLIDNPEEDVMTSHHLYVRCGLQFGKNPPQAQ